MTAFLTTATPATPSHPVTTGGRRRRRVLALAAAETRLLLRNRIAAMNALLLPLLLVAAMAAINVSNGESVSGPALIASAVGATLVFLTYYNLVTTFVARREALVLQRMRTGELTDPEVLLGTAVPTLLVTVVQIVVVIAGVVVLGKWQTPVDAVLPLVALFGGAALMVVLAAASTAFTGTVETAQITTLPLVAATVMFSGLIVPLAGFPETVAQVARFLPLTPVVELCQLGLMGQTWDGRAVEAAGAWAAAPLPAAVLAGWLVFGAVAARILFRWAPRR
jgi:ABC-2 type transport system permease protein